MSKAITKESMAPLKEASEMFDETGCVPGIDGEQVPAERIVPEAKEYISETIDDPGAIYEPAIWDTPGFALVVSWLAQKWQRRCQILAPRRSKNPAQHLTNEQQKQLKPILQDEFKQLKAVKDDASMSPEQKKAKAAKIHAGAKSQIGSILTPEQKKKLAAMKESHENK
jgi:Spy/CpxP family protein refolding chaperone